MTYQLIVAAIAGFIGGFVARFVLGALANRRIRSTGTYTPPKKQ